MSDVPPRGGKVSGSGGGGRRGLRSRNPIIPLLLFS